MRAARQLDDVAHQLVLPEAQAAYAEERCETHGNVDLRTYAGRDHVPLVDDDSPFIPELIAWTQGRFDGEPATPTCT